MTALPGRETPTDLYHRFEGYDELQPLLEGSDEDVLVKLGKPALIRIPGTTGGRARFVACLLHGNEDSGYRAVLRLLRAGRRYGFDLWVFIGNVRAASHEGWFAHRHLDDQEDFNRVWGLQPATTRMRRCAMAVLEELAGAALDGAIDLHNNTGQNPHYAILPRISPEGVCLAATCADTVLQWGLPAHTLMEAMADRCATAAVECGLPGLDANIDFAEGVLDRFLAAPSFEDGSRKPLTTFEMLHRVVVRPEVPFVFGGSLTDDVDLVLVPGLDAHNFGMLFAGTVLGHSHPDAAMPLLATDMGGRDVTGDFFAKKPDGSVVTTQDITPIMMVTTPVQARRDCLFYITRRRA